jgi:hypothetical protein
MVAIGYERTLARLRAAIETLRASDRDVTGRLA